MFSVFSKKDCDNCKYGDNRPCKKWIQSRCQLYNGWEPKETEPDQAAKADAGKPRLTLVPRQIIRDIAVIREFGTQKYGSPDNWVKVEIERYRDAAFRHFLAYLDNPDGFDQESGYPHLAHLACNIAFLCELEARRG